MNWRKIRKWILLTSLVVLLGMLIAAWYVGGLLVAPANRIVGPTPKDFPAQAVQITSESGSTLAAWHLELDDSPATIILLHPIRGDRRSMLSRARRFRDHGYSTLLVDLQAHGESPGENITVGYLEQRDVLAAIRFVRERNPDQKVGIVGRSLGGAATLLAQPNADLIVLESVYPTVTEAVHNRVKLRLGPLHHVFSPLLLAQLQPRLGISPDQLCPIEQLSKLGCPILIASGDHDQHTTIQETERMFSTAQGSKKLVIFEGAEHVDLFAYDSEKYENEIIEWVNEILGSNTPSTID